MPSVSVCPNQNKCLQIYRTHQCQHGGLPLPWLLTCLLLCWCLCSADVNAVTADVVDFHSRHMLRCLSPTSVPFLACGNSGWPCCHLATQCHVWAGVGWGPLPSTVLHGWAPLGLGCGPRMGCRRSGCGAGCWLKHTSSLKDCCWGEVLCVWSRDLREPVYSGRGGGAVRLHKNACVMTGAVERRNALHNPNTVGARPGLRWQPFLPIYFSSFYTQSLALSVALSIPGKMKNALLFKAWDLN